jgi:thiol:disulfide interchange protein DsbD
MDRTRTRVGPNAAALLTLLCAATVAGAERRAGDLPAPPEVPAGAWAETIFDGEANRVEARLLTSAERVRPGETFQAGVLFDLDPGWHMYWRSPGDSGLPTQLDWVTEGVTVGETEWVTPAVFAESEGTITTYGYGDRVLLPAQAVVAANAQGTVQLEVTAGFLACDILCIPGQVQLRRSLPVSATPEAAPAAVLALFENAAADRPVAGNALGLEASVLYSQSAIRPGDAFTAAVTLGCQGRADCTPPRLADAELGYTFIPDLVEGVQLSVTAAGPHPLAEGDVLVELKGRAGAAARETAQTLSGIAALIDPESGAPVSVEFALPLPRAPAGEEVARVAMPWGEALRSAADRTGAAPPVAPLHALLLALLGGLILNAMPCVLPVLAIKLFAMSELAQHDPREVRAHGAAYLAGVVGSMLLLAAAVSALRAGGEAVGWGFQFQEPTFVAAICVLLVIFALNLFGVFEFLVPTGALADLGANESGPRRSFFEGLLAVALATPCSAPFLGTAVGFALAGSSATIFAIFAAIGVGLAAPFVLVTWIPGWGRWVPRPGSWMNSLRAVLGFAVLATVVWLLWVVGRLIGADGTAGLLALLVTVAFLTWVFGQLQAHGRPSAGRAVVLGAVLATGAALAFAPLETTPPESRAGGEPVEGKSDRLTWSPDAVQRALALGKPVFVYFTADWCITCKVNERGTLASQAVQQAFDRLGVEVLRGDWTRRDRAIAEELARFGKGGVPMYLVYSPERSEAPILLPELLTPNGVVRALEAAVGP